MHYYSSNSVLKILKNTIKSWFVLDRDELSQEDAKRIKDNLGEQAIHIWKKRELENYLIDPDAILQLLKYKAGLQNKTLPPIDSKQMKAVIESCAEELTEFAITKRAAHKVFHPIYPRPKSKELLTSGHEAITKEITEMEKQIEIARSNITAAVTEASEEVKAIVRGEQEGITLLDIVPGEELLDSIFQQFGYRFNKKSDCERLAGFFSDKKIHPEIKELLNEIVS